MQMQTRFGLVWHVVPCTQNEREIKPFIVSLKSVDETLVCHRHSVTTQIKAFTRYALSGTVFFLDILRTKFLRSYS